MDIELRLEKPSDYAETETVVREAFWNVYAPGCCEHYLVHVIRESHNFVRELDFVAVSEDQIVGCVMFVKGTVLGDDGVTHEVLTLGPLAVLPSFQNKGIGRRLIEHAQIEAARQGYKAIILCGEPRYYARAGFEAAENSAFAPLKTITLRHCRYTRFRKAGSILLADGTRKTRSTTLTREPPPNSI